MRGELSASAMAIGRQVRAAETTRAQLSETLLGRDFITVLTFSAIGLVVALCLTLLLSFSDDMASVLAQFG